MGSYAMGAQPAPNGTASKRALGLVFTIMMMDVVGLTILVPVAPYIVGRYSPDALMVTMLSVLYAGAQFVAAPALGKISDRVGRRPVLLVCILGSAIGYFVFGVGGALWVLFLSRVIDGITGGNISTAAAYIVDVSRVEDRAKNMTIIGMAYGLGFILGPALGGALGQVSLSAPVFAAGLLSLLGVVLVYFLLPESLPPERRDAAPLRLHDFNPLASIAYMLRKPGLGAILLVYGLFNLGFAGINSVLNVFVVHKFGVQPWQIGLLFVVAGLATTGVQGALVPRLTPKAGEKRLALVAVVGNATGGLLTVLAPLFWMLYPVVFLHAALVGFIWSTLGTLAANCVPDHEQGQLAGVNAALSGLMAMLGPLWAGAVYDHVAPGAPYWLSAGLMVLACLALSRVTPVRLAGRSFRVQTATGD